MSWWQTTKVWCLAHWRWIVFSIASLAAFLLGYSKARDWQIKATDAKKNYEKEKEIIERLGEKQIEENLAHVEARDEAHQNNVLSFEKKMKELKKEKIRRMLEDSKEDPEAINRYLEEMGIEKE
tara:strand:+ start:60 stop:431 length:372 start_codon:yes stop_codon:yes gene_type:complete